jgi:hypothetical protein
MSAVYFAQCPSCGVYARFLIDRGAGWAVLFCLVCDPVLIANEDRAHLPSHYAHLWCARPWPRYPSHALKAHSRL